MTLQQIGLLCTAVYDGIAIFLCLWLSGAEFVVHVSAEVWLALGVFEGEQRTGIVRFW